MNLINITVRNETTNKLTAVINFTTEQLDELTNELALREVFSACLSTFLKDPSTQDKIEILRYFKIDGVIMCTEQVDNGEVINIVTPTLFFTPDNFSGAIAYGIDEFAYNKVWKYDIEFDQDITGCEYCASYLSTSEGSDSETSNSDSNQKIDLTKVCPLWPDHSNFALAFKKYAYVSTGEEFDLTKDNPNFWGVKESNKIEDKFDFWKATFTIEKWYTHIEDNDFDYPYQWELV